MGTLFMPNNQRTQTLDHFSKYFATEKYNVIILAGGLGTRMGQASDYIPKALSTLGRKRAIDYIIEKYDYIAHRYVLGVSAHSDLMSSYVCGKYSHLDISFSNEKILHSTSRSAALCLDSACSTHPTIIQFCDLIVEDPLDITKDSLFLATRETKGVVGTFRHAIIADEIRTLPYPEKPNNELAGLAGIFSFGNTPLLKSLAYSSWGSHHDITEDIVKPYKAATSMKTIHLGEIYEYGTEHDLRLVSSNSRYSDA